MLALTDVGRAELARLRPRVARRQELLVAELNGPDGAEPRRLLELVLRAKPS